jgi:hypothetical protein
MTIIEVSQVLQGASFSCSMSATYRDIRIYNVCLYYC